MRTFLIDPLTRKISIQEWHKLRAGTKQLEKVQALVDTECITAIRPWATSDAIYIDDEGLVKGPVYQFFGVIGYPQPVAGRGLVVGTDGRGEDQTPRIDLARLLNEVVFIERLLIGKWGLYPASNPRSCEVLPLEEIMRRLQG